MPPTVHPDTQPTGASKDDIDKWFELGLLVMSGGAILAVVAWIESALVG